MSKINDWIANNVKDLTFCDIGGIGINCQNERVSVALNADAEHATMIDFRRFGFPEWEIFDELMKKGEYKDFSCIDDANLESSQFPEKVGKYDFVHSTGILYHAPSPMNMIHNLSKITNKYLVVNTVIVPEKIETSKGNLDFSGSKILFLPGLSEQEREILDEYYVSLLGWPKGKFNTLAPRFNDENAGMPYLQTRAKDERYFWRDSGEMSYSPYWTLFSKEAFRAAVSMFGFEIIEEQSFRGHTLGLFCKRKGT